MYTVSITSQGQISIPADIRKKLNLGASKKATVSTVDNGILIRPVIDFIDLAGKFKTSKKPLSNTSMHELFGKSMADRKSRN